MAKILQIGMIPHKMPLFKFICALYQFHHQTLPIMKIDRGQIQFRDYVSTGTEPFLQKCSYGVNFVVFEIMCIAHLWDSFRNRIGILKVFPIGNIK